MRTDSLPRKRPRPRGLRWSDMTPSPLPARRCYFLITARIAFAFAHFALFAYDVNPLISLDFITQCDKKNHCCTGSVTMAERNVISVISVMTGIGPYFRSSRRRLDYRLG